MKILVTGSLGFVGRHVLTEMHGAGHDVVSCDMAGGPGVRVCDIRDRREVEILLDETRPEACIHLAGIAFVPACRDNPREAFAINVDGTVNLLEAVRKVSPWTRVVVASSSQVYGTPGATDPITESAPLLSGDLYSVTKIAADLATLAFASSFRIPAMSARPINHTGPGQSDRFVTTAFAAQLADIAAGRAEPVMKVGNLDSRRDFLDVRDVARAYRLLVERGEPGRAYNIATGRLLPIRVVLDMLCRIAGVKPRIEVDPALYRPTDSAPVLDTSRLRATTGWRPELPIETTLRDVYQDCQGRREPH